jgi:hypothetical protein
VTNVPGNIEIRDGRPFCGLSNAFVDLETGHCGNAADYDETHTHCPFCGSDFVFCQHYLADWSEDSYCAQFEIPDIPEEWAVPGDWTDRQLNETLGSLRDAFLNYATEPNGAVAARHVLPDLYSLASTEIRGIDWVGDGMASGSGTIYYAEDRELARTEVELLIAQLGIALHSLEGLRTHGSKQDTV